MSDCGRNKQDTTGQHRRRIAGAHAEQIGSKKAILYQCECEPNAKSREDEFRSLGKDKPGFAVVAASLWEDDRYCFARAASIAAMSIFRMVIIAFIARLAAARSGSVTAASRARGVICHEKPHRSLHQPHALSWPP
jgi:hypothetical protein